MTGLFLALLLAAAPGAEPAPGGGPRVALLVGNDTGLPGEAPLRSTGTDVERLASVLRELGGFAPEDVHVLANRTAGEILDALDALGRRPTASTLLFFYSGHADAGALHLAGSLLPVDLLLHRLRGVGAGLRLTVLDACQSGGAARPKGSSPAPPFQLRAEGPDPAGDVFISSSAADEQSFEGEHGGVFTLHWTAGLRGAADASGDGQVTLGEAYEYAYAQTLRATLAASTGPQHAAFRYDLAGRRDPVLTRLSGGALLTLVPASDGDYVLFDGRERLVVAELPARAGVPRRLALPAGEYVVRLRGPRSLRLARVRLDTGDDRVLLEHQLQEAPLLRLARKGSLGGRWLLASAGQLSSTLGPSGLTAVTAGVEWEGERWLVVTEAGLSAGQEEHLGLTTQDASLEASAAALWSTHLGAGALRLGPIAGLGLLRQRPEGQPSATSLSVSLGLRLRADLAITPAVGLFAQVEGRGLLVRVEGDAPDGMGHLWELGLYARGAWAAGLRGAF